MMRGAAWALAAAATITVVSAQRTDVPHGGGMCTTDDDCSLGGLCSNAKCVCDPWFTGRLCTLLNLQAPDDSNHGTCGPDFDSYYSWGGRAILGDDGKWHLYASFMCDHKNLGSWTTDSSSAHFISDNPTGPFTWSPEQCKGDICTPAVIPWSHNTVVIVDSSSEEARWQIWHVGDGIAPASKWEPCFNKSDVGRPKPMLLDDARAGDMRSDLKASPGQTAYVTYSAGPNGPWTRGLGNAGVTINFTGSWTNALAGNPAPLVMPDGSINLYFTAASCPPHSGALEPNCIAMAKSTNGWQGPFQMDAAPHPVTYPESEDPSVFRDPRGNYHMLTNVNTGHQRCLQGVECGGHAWSRDGKVFSNLTIGAFGPYITFANGTGWANAYTERPLVTLDKSGKPLAFYVGMGRSAYMDSCNWAQLFCTGAEGEICGPTIRPS